MASKASMLKQGVNRTGKGLFNGMQSLNARTEAEDKNVKETVDIPKEENTQDKMTEKVNEKTDEKPVVEEPVKEVTENVAEEAEAFVEEVETVTKEAEIPVIPEPIEEEPKAEPVKKDITEEIISTINKREKPSKNVAEKSSSRYEKDKFLLLDIRGYRDYVEHMAKASNTSATKYIRNLIQKDMDKNIDIYNAHKKLEEMLKERTN